MDVFVVHAKNEGIGTGYEPCIASPPGKPVIRFACVRGRGDYFDAYIGAGCAPRIQCPAGVFRNQHSMGRGMSDPAFVFVSEFHQFLYAVKYKLKRYLARLDSASRLTFIFWFCKKNSRFLKQSLKST